MRLTKRELTLIRNYLHSKRAYRCSPPPADKIWESWMEGFLQKIEDELAPYE